MEPQHTITVSSTINSSTILQKAADLAAELKLPFVASREQISTKYGLFFTPEGLQLLHISPESNKTVSLLHVDFVHGKSGFRLAKNCTTKQPLARAAGIKAGARPRILDGTAGLGSDAFVLASLGCRVTMCERSPILGALLQDGLQRAKANSKTATIVKNGLDLVVADSKEYLLSCSETFQTIYLDPMYPHRNQSALSKQTLRTIRALVGGDLDGAALLEIAFQKAENRVVVKRPLKAPRLSELPPNHSIFMKNSRFDIYLTFNT